VRRRNYVVLFVIGTLTACVAQSNPSPSPSVSASQNVANSASEGFALSSSDLASGQWPASDTCDGADTPPDLHWTAGPAGTASYVLQVFDPDAPNGGFSHWMLANEPPDLRQPTPGTGVSGRNDFGVEGYNGPCPPKGTTHHYVVTVYAVDAILPLQRLYSRAQFQQALASHVLAQANLTATYRR
jgi:Raf kinase inhibitor-like YbhB/YbcL family protein